MELALALRYCASANDAESHWYREGRVLTKKTSGEPGQWTDREVLNGDVEICQIHPGCATTVARIDRRRQDMVVVGAVQESYMTAQEQLSEL